VFKRVRDLASHVAPVELVNIIRGAKSKSVTAWDQESITDRREERIDARAVARIKRSHPQGFVVTSSTERIEPTLLTGPVDQDACHTVGNENRDSQ
jgi:hypothetical protein